MESDKKKSTENPGVANSDPQKRRIVMQVDEVGKAPYYANAFQVQTGQMEVVLDFGYRTMTGQISADADADRAEIPNRLRFLIANRVALPYPVARQLATMLQQALQDVETRSGEKK